MYPETGGCPCLFISAAHRKKIRTTNNLERFNEEIRRTRVIRIFPNEEPIFILSVPFV
ncbi:transposase [Candidatus Aerophobetes bacterium]|nr:transposase [Candidatus Aerophobetes bacterium]